MVSEYCIFGLDNYMEVIEECLTKHKLQSIKLDIQMILTEAINNAFIHGNCSDNAKPIHIRVRTEEYELGKRLHIEVQDCGCGCTVNKKLDITDDIHLMMESGRGLFLIQEFSDEIEFIDSTLHVYKGLKEEQ